MLSPYFVPRKRVGALRSYKFAKHLKNLDWQVRVIHLEAKGQRLSESEKTALDGVGLFGLKTPFDRTINRSGSDLGVVEKAVAMAVLEKRHNLAKLKKLKDYVTMKRCTFRDEQLKKLIGD